MTPSLAAPVACFADHARYAQVEVLENVRLARDTYRIRLPLPDLAARIVPGQFVMVRIAGYDDPLLGRPFALYDTVLDDADRPTAIDLVYLVVGKMTARLARLRPGDQVAAWGPLGNGFVPLPAERLLMVAGGIGQTPFPAVAQEALGLRAYGAPARPALRVGEVVLCYGARNREYLAGIEDFERLGVKVHVSTDDGTAGLHGRVTDLLDPLLAAGRLATTRVACCGPEPMLAAVARKCAKAHVMCHVSLETPMACGLGICFSCVAKVKDDVGGWDYRRTCVEGPVFDARLIEF